MKKIIILCCCAFMQLPAQVLVQLNNGRLQCYTYAGGDEFNENQLDEQRWTNGLGWTRVLMSQDLAFSPKNIIVQNGQAQFIARKEDSTYVLTPWEVDSNLLKKEKLSMPDGKFLTHYSAGCIISKQKYHYGLYELRFKVEQGRGVWPAFWFFGGNKNEEIDAFELKGERNNEIHVDTHCPYGCDRGYKNKLGINTNWGAWMPVSDYLHKGYNTMLLEWLPGSVTWYINGYPLAYFKGNFPNPMNLYLNTSVAKDGGPFKPGPDAGTIWPNSYWVDYFRAWQPVDSTQTAQLKPNSAVTLAAPFTGSTTVKPLRKSGLMYNKKKWRSQGGMLVMDLQGRQLNISLMGQLLEGEVAVSLTSPSGKTWHMKVNQQMWTINDLDPATDKSLELSIDAVGRHYTQKIALAW